MDIRLLQIIYSEETLRKRDPGFEMLDNMSNERPDWYEYWPIRQFFRREGIEDATFYGFFSPKFFSKSGLKREQLDPFIRTDDLHAVYIFSPFIEDSALFLNQIEQGQAMHPGLLEAFSRLYPRPVDAPPLVQTVANTAYCNYFVASGVFWREWLAAVDKTFVLAENSYSRVGDTLRRGTSHAGQTTTPMKVFCVERVAGMMLADNPQWHPVAPLAYDMPVFGNRLKSLMPDLVALDLIKQEAVRTGDYAHWLKQYVAERRALRQREWPPVDRSTVPAAQ